MKPRSILQLLIFLAILGLWYKIAWPMMTKEALVAGAIGGIILHWGLTNKGNRNIINIKPLSGGFRVLLYDMMFVSFLVALAQQNGSTVLEVLMDLNEKTAFLASLIAGIVVDYSVGG